MKAYDLNSRFTFGKYEGKTLEDVFQQDPAYVEKCMVSEEDFSVDEKSIQKLFEKYPDIEISDAAIDANLDKLDALDTDDDDLMFSEGGAYEEEFEDFDDIADKLEKDDEFDDLDDLGKDLDDLDDDWDEDNDY